MRILFRFDSSEIIGHGHLYRCFELGNFFEKKGHDCFYLTNNQDLKLKNYFTAKNNNIFFINSRNNLRNHFLRWTNVMQIEDVKLTKYYIFQNNINIVVRDHYGLDYIWDRELPANCKLIVIDDLKKNKNYCDIYINYHHNFFKKKNHNLLLKKYCLPLLGVKYFISKDINVFKKKRFANQIFIYMGGADKNNFASYIFKILNNRILKKYKKVFLFNKKNKQHIKLQKKAKIIKSYQILFSPIKDIEKYYINSVLCITAAGVSLYKQILCKTNSLVIPQTYSQKIIINLLKKKKIFHTLSNIKFLNVKKILFAINNKQINLKNKFLDYNGKSRILKKIKFINQNKNI